MKNYPPVPLLAPAQSDLLDGGTFTFKYDCHFPFTCRLAYVRT